MSFQHFPQELGQLVVLIGGGVVLLGLVATGIVMLLKRIANNTRKDA